MAAETDPVLAGLREAWTLLQEELGDGHDDAPSFGGKLLRPRFAASVAGTAGSGGPGSPFWFAALAIQLAHEASLLHDDVVDGAELRRREPTLVKRGGVGAALIEGDRLLARGYAAALRTGSLEFATAFAHAVDRTIAGERAQARAAGRKLDEDGARALARGKSGELFGAALAAGAILDRAADQEELAELGRKVGTFYQRVDDLLDFCPAAATGKDPFADVERGLWTWPQAHLPSGAHPRALFHRRDGSVPALRALAALEAEGRKLLVRLQVRLPWAHALHDGVRGWIRTAGEGVGRELEARRAGPEVPVKGRSEGSLSHDPRDILKRHGRSFHFASHLLSREVRGPMTRLYAFCRTVDDAVDRAPDSQVAEAQLHHLLRRARTAYDEGVSSVPLLTEVMAEMREAKVPFRLVEELVEGVRMDLHPTRYETMEELEVYTHRVAGVVGLWIAGLAGVRDPWAQEMAGEMGRAMQLTNIARDVGEDLRMGRVYLPQDLLERHGVEVDALEAVARGGGEVSPGFAAVLEELMCRADAGYGAASQALPHLPPGYRRAMAVAARVYQGIHREIRRSGYDTLRHRAYTGGFRKVRLAGGALKELREAERRVGG